MKINSDCMSPFIFTNYIISLISIFSVWMMTIIYFSEYVMFGLYPSVPGALFDLPTKWDIKKYTQEFHGDIISNA